MRVLIVDTWYARVLDAVYAARPDLAAASYTEQWRALMATSFATSDAYSHYLGELGHEAHELIVNCAPLQAAWTREHVLRPPRLGRLLRPPEEDAVVLAQVEEFRPDVVYMQNLTVLSDRTLRWIRRGRLLVGQIATELPPRRRLRQFDLLLTSFPHYVERLPRLGVDAAFFRIGFDPRVLERIGTDGARSDGAVFVGSYGRVQHTAGTELLEQAARHARIAFWGPGADEWPADSHVRRDHRGEAWGLEMYRLLARARIAINRHASAAEDYANNMRLYEATGVGTLLLTDAKRNLGELFEPGREVVTYASADELAERIRYYLEHDQDREAIARAGQARTLAEHTYAHRMRELTGLLEPRL